MSSKTFNRRRFGFALVAVVFLCLSIIARPFYVQTPVFQLEQKQLPQPKEHTQRLPDLSHQGRSHLQRLSAKIAGNTAPSNSSTTITASSNVSFWDNLLDVSTGWDYSSSDQSWQEILTEEQSRTAAGDVNTGVMLINHSLAINACPERRPISRPKSVDDVGTGLGSGLPTELYNLAPKVFDSVPSKFIKGFRIPCWLTTKKGTDHLLCLPSFFLAGIPKGGTTDLWSKIMAHPDVIRVVKEPHWWTRRRIIQKKNGKPMMSITEYAHHFKNAAVAIQRGPKMTRNLIVGDGSASTFWDNQQWGKHFPMDVCKDGPPYVIADVIRHVLPKSKIVVIFRNPTDRLYSDYIYFGSKKQTEISFHEDVTDTIKEFNRCAAKWSRRACAYSAGYYTENKPKVRLHIGLYSIYVRDWLKSFPRDQLLFLRLEDWYARCPQILPQVHGFLKLEPQTEQSISRTCSQKLQNPTKKKSAKMLDKTRRILDDFYANTRYELAALLQDDIYLWK